MVLVVSHMAEPISAYIHHIEYQLKSSNLVKKEKGVERNLVNLVRTLKKVQIIGLYE